MLTFSDTPTDFKDLAYGYLALAPFLTIWVLKTAGTS